MMFALGLRYLNGWSMAAADGTRKEQAEWPPHPDRVFMALAAAWFETGKDVEEGAALRWLEALSPPALSASGAAQRTSVVSYVPVNDDGGGKKSSPKNELERIRSKGLAVVPEHRMRQPRSCPVAIPHNPVVHLIWHNSERDGHLAALGRLAEKVTRVGHSASFVQAWVEDGSNIQPIWIPTEGLADLRLRVPSICRLARLAKLANHDAWIAYHDLNNELDRAKVELKAAKQPPRVVWRNFPDAVLLASERETLTHSQYPSAKSGDARAAGLLVDELVGESDLANIRLLFDGCEKDNEHQPLLVSAHAYERDGFNAIPAALARLISQCLGISFDTKIVQTNIVGHTGADGYGRLARQAAFDGNITRARSYIMVDDFIGQGGTLANLRGWIEKRGGKVIGAVGLTGKSYSAKLNPTQEQLHELRQKHGPDLEKWWLEWFGHAFDCLTQSEARYLTRSPDADTIRNRIIAAMREGGGGSRPRSLREQRQRIKKLKAQLDEQFPDGTPNAPMRPVPAKWHGYVRSKVALSEDTPHSIFDPRMVVFAMSGRQVSLSATLKLSAALRGLLMRESPVQPPPEWFSGHGTDGGPTTEPHLALAPLPFVGAPHADGRILGMAIVLPQALAPDQAGGALGSILHDTDTGLPREHRLFDGKWIECDIAIDIRERPPINLQPSTWVAKSRVWASVTPIVLNRHFNGHDVWERAAESVKDACEHIQLPRPVEVLLYPVSIIEGVPHAGDFPCLRRKRDGGRQSHTHAVIVFEEPVVGPVLIGAGRFRGYGLCRPMDH